MAYGSPSDDGSTMNLLGKTKRILRTYRIVPRKRLGQNFLVDNGTLGKMVFHASLSQEDVALDVGAGLGFLTERLAEKAKQVIAVEIDPRLVRVLKDRFRNCRNVSILHGDIMELVVPRFNKVVSTPPYSISSPLLFWLLEKKCELGVLAFQEEFARRLAASVGSDDYGRLTITASYRAYIQLLDHIPRELFWPPPRVDSTIVRLRPRKPPFSVEDEEVFFEVVKTIFSQKNRKLRNAILPFFGKYRIPKGEALELADDLQFSDERPRQLIPEEIGQTANEVLERLRKSNYIPT